MWLSFLTWDAKKDRRKDTNCLNKLGILVIKFHFLSMLVQMHLNIRKWQEKEERKERQTEQIIKTAYNNV